MNKPSSTGTAVSSSHVVATFYRCFQCRGAFLIAQRSCLSTLINVCEKEVLSIKNAKAGYLSGKLLGSQSRIIWVYTLVMVDSGCECEVLTPILI